MGKLFSFRKPNLRVTKKGLKLTTPSARIGGKSGINLSKRGASASIRTPLGTATTGKFNPLKTSKKKKESGCFGILMLTILLILIILVVLI